MDPDQVAPVSREQIYENIIDDFDDGVYCVNTERRIFFWSHSAERITGYLAEEMLGKSCFDSKLDHIDMQQRQLCSLMCPLVGTMFDGKRRQEQVFARHRGGRRIPLVVRTYPIMREDRIIGATEVFHEYLQPQCNDRRLDAVMGREMHDPLTGLANSDDLSLVLSCQLRDLRSAGRPFVIALADIEHFDQFNRTYGHDTGDRLLVSIADRFRHHTRGDDIIGRWEEDVFLAVFAGASAQSQRRLAEKLRTWITDSGVGLNGQELHVTAAVGAAAAQADDTVAGLLDRCGRMLRAAKSKGGGCIETAPVI